MLTTTAFELEGTLTPVERFGRLLDWMVDKFIFAGLAAIFRTKFLSPRGAPRRGGERGFDRRTATGPWAECAMRRGM